MEADILPCLGARPIDAIEAPELVGMTKAIEQHVADIWDCHKKWGAKGAFFLTGPLPDPDGWEWRCHMRDPDGYIIEVGQYTQLAIDWFNSLS
jgi:hypothetical protein